MPKRHEYMVVGEEAAQHTLEADPVALQALHGLLEQLLTTGGNARDVVLFPLDRSVYMLEDLLNGVGDFGTNPVTGDKSNLGAVQHADCEELCMLLTVYTPPYLVGNCKKYCSGSTSSWLDQSTHALGDPGETGGEGGRGPLRKQHRECAVVLHRQH
jgi:hypothetical protein